MTSETPKTPLLSVDCVVFNADGDLLLIKRRNPPFKGTYALPGGFVDLGESVEDAARRELAEETGIKVKKLVLVGVYSDPKRDPRGGVVSVAFLAAAGRQTPVASDDAASAAWIDDWRQKRLAFDHAKILVDASKLRRQLKPKPRKS